MIVAANRGPVTYERAPDGSLTARRGAGGLVSALSSAIGSAQVRWIASAVSDGDHELAASQPGGRAEQLAAGAVWVRLLEHDPSAYRAYYATVANPVLWFTQHQLWNLPYEPSFGAEFEAAWSTGYAVVNEAFGKAVASELEARPTAPVIVNDYHLYLAPHEVRTNASRACLGFFVHIPWPPPEAFSVLPRGVVRDVLTGLLKCDLVGFHTPRWRDNFTACCAFHLDARVADDGVVVHGGRRTRACVRPISVSPAELRAAAQGDNVRAELARLAGPRSEQLIVRVDRADPSKNVVRGFEALELLLERYPEHVGRVRMLALLNPSREDVGVYRAYRAAIESAADRANARFGTHAWKPVQLEIADNFARSLAAYALYDVLLVNPIYDGMNLVVKEGPLLNERDGVVVLSDNAGAYEELHRDVVGVHAFDVGEQAEALHRALTLDDAERACRAEGLRSTIEARPIAGWVDGLLSDLAEVVELDGRRIET